MNEVEIIGELCQRLTSELYAHINNHVKLKRFIRAIDQLVDGDFKAFYKLKKEFDDSSIIAQKRISPLIESLEHRIKPYCCIPNAKDVDVVIITALENPELAAVKEIKVKENKWKYFKYLGEQQIWHFGKIARLEGEVGVVIGTPNRMGMPAMAVITTKAVERWYPKVIILCGICAGIQDDVGVGDILIPSKIFVHDSGKINAGKKSRHKKKNDPWTVTLDREITSEIDFFGKHYCDKVQSEINSSLHELVVKCDLKSHIGPLACGNVVVNSPKTVAEILIGERKTLGLEMEAYGFMSAVDECNTSVTKGVVLKSVCDFGTDKDDLYQEYAAKTSAEFAYQFILNTRYI